MNPACMDFYPRPPRGGRRFLEKSFIGLCLISIHALREEGDGHQAVTIMIAADFYPRPPRGGRQLTSATAKYTALFLSTPSARRATDQQAEIDSYLEISIHALREEGDRNRASPIDRRCNFYPRPPRGGRRRPALPDSSASYFYPRPPRGGRLYRGCCLSDVV